MKLPALALMAALALALGAAGARAEGRVAKPAISVDPTRGHCVAPPEEMRRNHMAMLQHQRDRTLRLGERGAKVSLNACVNCHAGKTSGRVIGSRQEFCEGCHAYAGVTLDCFECHQSKAKPIATASGAAQ
jgi:hypothetical protein